MNETLKAIRERRSIRKYKAEQIKDSELNAVLEAGTWAPTGKGMQSPVMVAVQDKETIAYLSKMNAQIMGNPGADPFYGAPTVVVVLADGENPNWHADGTLVMGNLLLAAHAVGLGSCWINRATELFDMPEGKALLKSGDWMRNTGAWDIVSSAMRIAPLLSPSPARKTTSFGCEETL